MGCTNSTVKLEESKGYKNEDKDDLYSDHFGNNVSSPTVINGATLQSDGVKNENLDNADQCEDGESSRVSFEPNFTLIQKEFHIIQNYHLVMSMIS